jgi:hypothetical protein
MKKNLSILVIILFGAPLLVFAQVSPTNDTSSTAAVSASVFQEVVSLPLYILQKYETPLVGMALIFALFSAIFGLLKYFDLL